MSDLKDSAIKLFGKTIPLPLVHRLDLSSANESSSTAGPASEDFPDENTASSLENISGREEGAQEINRVRVCFFFCAVHVYILDFAAILSVLYLGFKYLCPCSWKLIYHN